MKTFNKFTPDEKRLYSAKSSLSYNFEVLAQIGHFLTSKVSDAVIIEGINECLEDFIEATDRVISKFLSNNESDNKENTH